MRKILSLVFLLTVFFVNAESLKFMGIPIEGKVEDFESKLKSKGFEYVTEWTTEDSSVVRSFAGNYLDLPGVVCVEYEPESKNVVSVIVQSESVPEDKLDTTWLYYQTHILSKLKEVPYDYNIESEGIVVQLTIFNKAGQEVGNIFIAPLPDEKQEDMYKVVTGYFTYPEFLEATPEEAVSLDEIEVIEVTATD